MELFCVVTLQYQILVRIAIAYFIIEKKKAAPQPWQAIAQRFCSICNLRYGTHSYGMSACKIQSVHLLKLKVSSVFLNLSHHFQYKTYYRKQITNVIKTYTYVYILFLICYICNWCNTLLYFLSCFI